MKQIITSEKKPIKMWLENIEPQALVQAKNLANLPFLFKHVALMSDCHLGYGMPIGGVLVTQGAIIPNSVGMDIGCGMLAVQTSLTSIDLDTLKKIKHQIERTVPVGFKHHRKPQGVNLMPDLIGIKKGMIINKEFQSARYQLGTLGGGNHFIEIQKGDDGHIWFMIHSGSRNLGYKVAKHYDALAKELNAKWHSLVPKEYNLAFLPMDTEEARNYMFEMQYCVDFALNNRLVMTSAIMEAFCDNIDDDELSFDGPINIAHNYAAMENHYGKNVMVTRKGATKATKGELGIIPGSQGSKSYIVKGLGNPESFMSCSHGAGRALGRKAAQKTLNLEDEQRILDNQGILHNIKKQADLEEATSAYKPIDEVMRNQSDLVEIMVTLQPLAVIKS